MSKTRLTVTNVFIVLLMCGIVGGLATRPLLGQDLQQYKEFDRYRYLPRLPQPSDVPDPLPNQPKEISGDAKVFLKELKGLVFVDDPGKLNVGSLDVTGVKINSEFGLGVLRDPEFTAVTDSYLGKPVSMRKLNELIGEIILFYRKQDQPVVDVSIPANQEITSGVIQLLITESRVGKVIVKGTRYFNPEVLVKQPFISPGDVILESVLTKDLQWLKRNPFRTVDLELTPGGERGETDVVFNVNDRLPWRIYSGYEDTGNRSTGLERTFYGFNWFNAFNRDDQAGYQYTASSDFSKLGSHSAFYSTALPNRDIVTLFGNYAEYNSPIALFGSASGITWQVLARRYRELDPIGKYKHNCFLGFDVKQTNNNLDFGGTLIFGQEIGIVQLLLGYNGRYDDSTGSWSFGADGYFSPGNFGGNNHDTDFQAIRPFATANYFYARGFLERRQPWICGLELIGRFTGQLSEANLMVTEQLGLGGHNSVRGFDLYSSTQDSGFFINLEVHTKPFPVGIGEDEMSLLAFYDYGQGYNHTLLPGEPSTRQLQGVGAGLRYHLSSKVELRADYGWQIDANPAVLPFRHRAHVGCVLSF